MPLHVRRAIVSVEVVKRNLTAGGGAQEFVYNVKLIDKGRMHELLARHRLPPGVLPDATTAARYVSSPARPEDHQCRMAALGERVKFAKTAVVIVVTLAPTMLAISCGGSATQPIVAPTPVLPPAPQAGLAGTWTGTGADSQGAITVAWSLTQSGDSVSGTVKTQAVNPNDGSCNSCHRNKSGSLLGTISKSTLNVTMFFAAGGNGDPTPACSATLTGRMAIVAEPSLTVDYAGADTCEGPFMNGTLVMVRPP